MIRVLYSPVYYIKTVLMFLLTVGLVYVTYLLFISAIMWLKLLGIIWGLSSVVMILFLVSYIRRCKCYLSIDQRGIKGYYCNIHHLLIPKFETIDVTWDKVNKIELTEEGWGRLTIDGLKLYVGKSPRLKTTINLELFPSKMVIDCINFHYANWQGVQDHESPLIEYKLVDNRMFRSLFGLGIITLILLITLL